MSASHAPALDAIAFQLLAGLDRYAQDAARMADSRLDIELYREVSEEMDSMRMFSSALPDARVEWVELLIAHAELVHGLWRTYHAGKSEAQAPLVEVRERHVRAVAALRRRCTAVLARPKAG